MPDEKNVGVAFLEIKIKQDIEDIMARCKGLEKNQTADYLDKYVDLLGKVIAKLRS